MLSKLNSMSEISGHDPDFKYIIALNRLMICFFPFEYTKPSFRDSVKPNRVREERESDETAPALSYAERHRLRSSSSGAPNENIVQNHLNIALLNVF